MSRFPHDMSYFGSPGTVPPHFSGLGLGGDTFSASKPSSSSEASHVASVNCKDASFEREWPQQMDNFLKPQESDLNGLGDATMINANAKVEELEAQLTHWKRVKDEGDALAKENAKKFGPYSVRIFWDYQNLPLPAKAEGNEIMDALNTNLRDYLRPQGRIDGKYVYIDATNKVDVKWDSQLQILGFKQVHCPSHHTKEEGEDTRVDVCPDCSKELNTNQMRRDTGNVDKVIVSDMWEFAFNCKKERKDCCICIITNDGDYTYPLSVLQDIGCHVVVMHGSNPFYGLSKAVGESVDFHDSVLQLGHEDKTQSTPVGIVLAAGETMASHLSMSEFANDSKMLDLAVRNSLESEFVSGGQAGLDPTRKALPATPLKIHATKDMILLMQAVQQIQRDNAVRYGTPWEETWASSANVSSRFWKSYPNPHSKDPASKDRLKAIKESCVDGGFIFRGRRKRTADNKTVIEDVNAPYFDKERLTPDFYHPEEYLMVSDAVAERYLQ